MHKEIYKIKLFLLVPTLLFSIAAASGQTVKPKSPKSLKKTAQKIDTPSVKEQNTGAPSQTDAPNRMADDAGNPNIDTKLAVNSILRVQLVKTSQKGPIKSLAGLTVYLLDENLDVILSGAGWPEAGQKSANIAFADKFAPGEKDFQKTFAVLAPHIKQSLKTDPQGQLTLENIPGGRYYLFAVYRSPNHLLAWNLPVEINQKIVEISLSQKNSFYQK